MPRAHIRREAAPAAVTLAVEQLGANIAAARLRRQWTQDELATKAGITRPTLQRIEAGALGTGIGAYVAALWAMGLHHPVETLAALEQDPEGATLATARLGTRARSAGTVDDAF